ncbi:hypothetical protein JYU34_001489 [Plutella xylostella]|uniref:RanBP2-type domain-containing protein n=1 Tax=Plutella xylostella TaxID=51655 RepID=A0ABQ7R448_PLUXY|nr:hypothetical protein JYU34_001489 [Plutella xylostella]
MSARADAAAAACACTNISLMQLFHELKQKFPAVPDHVVSSTIEQYCHDKLACEAHLQRETSACLALACRASSAAARHLSELRAPSQCPNQPIVRHEVQHPRVVNAVTCHGPQTAVIGSIDSTEEEEETKFNTDANQNVVEHNKNLNHKNNNATSPVTVINIDNCIAKYTAQTPSEHELTNEEATPEITLNADSATESKEKELEQPGSGNYRIHKSNKVKCNLNEKLEKHKEKKSIKKEEQPEQETENIPQEKPKRPNTLEFLKPIPDIAFKEPTKEPQPDTSKLISPAAAHKPESVKETTPGGSLWSGGYPLNLSVNVNCHMDYGRPYDPWLEDYDGRQAITSVNLTVCTPTSNMASPVRESRGEEGGFEGHVTVTVSPSASRAPRRRAPAPPVHPAVESQRSTRSTVDTSQDRSLIERQRERLGRLKGALLQERGRIAQLTREMRILAGPPPPPAAARSLSDYVHRLRDQCDTLAKRLEMAGTEPEAADFYSNIYTGQRPPTQRPARPAPPPPEDAPWQCHVCTFNNHPLLDKCEECDMPRILVGTSPSRTLDSGFGSFRDRNRRVETFGGVSRPSMGVAYEF